MLRRVFSNVNDIDLFIVSRGDLFNLINDIPPHEPNFQASSSPIREYECVIRHYFLSV